MHLQVIGYSDYPEVFKQVQEAVWALDNTISWEARDDAKNIKLSEVGITIPEVEGYYTSLVMEWGDIDFRVYRVVS